jgi:FkbM family methyltransferase
MSLAGRLAYRGTRLLRSTAAKLTPKRTRTVTIEGTPITFTKFQGDTALQIIGHHETEVYTYIAQLPKGCVFFDLGASIGNFALFAALRGLETVAFEPDQKSFQTLVNNVAANRLGNLRAFRIAISDGRNAEATLLYNSEKTLPGDHHKVLQLEKNAAHPGIMTHLDKRQVVQTLSIDQAIETLGLPFPDYMKIDIDGSELAFVQGGSRTLADPRLNGFIFELYKPSDLYPEIIDAIQGHGFTMTQEFQIYSGLPPVAEEGLFNMIFERRPA